MRWLTTTAAVVVAALMWPTAASAGLFDIETKLTASESHLTGFGGSVGISGNMAIVGSWRDDGGTGSAYLFDVTTGDRFFRLTASDAGSNDRFGVSVGISGNTAIIGAHIGNSAYLFDTDPLSPTFGDELFKLTATDTEVDDVFGASVAISGHRAIVGATHDDDGGSASGSAYLFDVTTGNQLIKLTASDATAGDKFGYRVGISGNRAIVGGRYKSAYLFDVDPLSPTFGDELFNLMLEGGARAVAIDGNRAIVGTWREEPGVGVVEEAILLDVTTGNELFKWTGEDRGNSVAISGNRAIVGVKGSAYLVDVTTGNELLTLTNSDVAEVRIGGPVGLSGNRAIVGAASLDRSYGAAYLFTSEPGDFDGDHTCDGADFLAWQRGESPYPQSNSDLAEWQANFGAMDSGDFDGDGDVDGADFLYWQRGESPFPLSQSDLASWEADYGTVAPLSASRAQVPEPATWLLGLLALILLPIGPWRARMSVT